MRMSFSLLVLFSILAAALTGGRPVAADPADGAHPHGDILDQVRAYLLSQPRPPGTEAEIEVDRLDLRLRVSACDRPLEAFLPPSGRTSGRVTVGVRCEGTSPWSLYVPARVQLFDRVLVASRDLPRGAILQRPDFTLERRDLTRLRRGYLVDPERALGKITDNPVRRGNALAPGDLETPDAVRRGGEVQILAAVGGVQVRMTGRALESGALGQRIRVENTSSGRELEAQVVSAGAVRVDI